MNRAAREELRDFASNTSSDELTKLANILERNLEEIERMNIEYKAQTAAGLKRLEEEIKHLGKQVKTTYDRIFNHGDGLDKKITAIETELKHKPSHKVLYTALFAQVTLFVAIVFGLAQFLK